MKLECRFESETQEFKTSLSELDKGILSLTAMLNKSGKGKVLFGVANDGTVLGLENSIGQETIKKIGVRVAEQVKPVIVPKISIEYYGDSPVIILEAEGWNRPYSASGEYRVRIGSENKKIDPSVISEMVLSNSNAQMENLEALNQDLKFEQLKGLFVSHGLTVNNKTFLSNAGLLTKRGTFNYLAEILSDENNCSIKVVRFKGKDKQEMVSRNEFGYRCLLVAMKAAYEYVMAFNEVRVDLNQEQERKEVPLFDKGCFDEAWTNACLHNKWIKNTPPAIYIFDDRIEIVSTGGLAYDYSKEDFFAGISRPVNIGLQKIMGQLDLVEQTGHGVPKIVARYGTQAFEIADSHITVKIPFAFSPSFNRMELNNLSPSYKKVLSAVQNTPTATMADLSKITGLGKSRLSAILSDLKSSGRIKRIGRTKGGFWQTAGGQT